MSYEIYKQGTLYAIQIIPSTRTCIFVELRNTYGMSGFGYGSGVIDDSWRNIEFNSISSKGIQSEINRVVRICINYLVANKLSSLRDSDVSKIYNKVIQGPGPVQSGGEPGLNQPLCW